MKFAFATALLAFTQVQAVEVATEIEAEWGNYYGNAISTVRRYVGSTGYYNGHGHHSYSSHSSSDYSSYSSDDYSSSDYGYGYRYYNGRNRYYRYQPRYYGGRYFYGSRYASYGGVYKAAYRSYPVRSYSACWGCSRTYSKGYAW